MVEYALVLVHSSMAGLGLLTQQVNAWVGDINWTLVGYAALCLVAFRIAVPRHLTLEIHRADDIRKQDRLQVAHT